MDASSLIVVLVVLVGIIAAVGGFLFYRSERVRERALRLSQRKGFHSLAKVVTVVSLAVIGGVTVDDSVSALGEVDIYYYATYTAYVGGGLFLIGYANVEILASLCELSYHPDYRSYKEENSTLSYLRRSDRLFNDWRYLMNEYHGGAFFAFWVGGAFLTLGGFLGLVEGSVAVATLSIISIGLGMAGIVAGSVVGWHRGPATGNPESDNPERVDGVVRKAREETHK